VYGDAIGTAWSANQSLYTLKQGVVQFARRCARARPARFRVAPELGTHLLHTQLVQNKQDAQTQEHAQAIEPLSSDRTPE